MPESQLQDGGEVRGVEDLFKDIKRTLKVPLVSSFFRVMSAYPEFLISYWEELKPNINTRFFFTAARQLRNISDGLVDPLFEYVDDYRWLQQHGFSREDIREIRYAVEMFHYMLPKLALLSSHLKLSLSGEDLSPAQARETSMQEPDFSAKVQIVRPNSAPKEVEYIYLDIKDSTHLPIINSIYQVFAHWPEYLKHVWGDEIKPVILTHDFDREIGRLRTATEDLARQLPYPFRRDTASINSQEKQEILRIAELYNRNMPVMMVVSSTVRNMLVEGERSARAAGEHLERKV